MPIDASNVERAQKVADAFAAQMAELSEDAPDFAAKMQKLTLLNQRLDEFYRTKVKVGKDGKLIEDAPGRIPPRVEAPKKEEKKKGPVDETSQLDKFTYGVHDEGKGKGFNYHFEPSIEEVKHIFRTNPDLVKSIGAGKWLENETPERIDRVPVGDPATGYVVRENVIPAKPWFESLHSGHEAYLAIAEYLWEQAANKAKAEGVPIQRYSKIKLEDQPLDYLVGGAEYIVDNRLAPAAMGVASSYTAGLGPALYDKAMEKGDYSQSMPSSGEIERRSPGWNLGGSLLGYGGPGNPLNYLQGGLTRLAGRAISQGLPRGASAARAYNSMSPLSKLGTSAMTGGAVAAGEGAIGRTGTALLEGESLPDSVRKGMYNMPEDFGLGALGGGGFDLLGQGAGALRTSARHREGMRDIKLLEDAGGRTHPVWGVEGTPEIEEAVKLSHKAGEVGSAAGIAAQKVAPVIQEAIEGRGRAARDKIARQKEEYFNHPYYGQLEVSGRPMLEAFVDLLKEGRYSAPVSGATRNIDPDRVRTIAGEAKRVGDSYFFRTKSEAESFAREHDGFVISRDTEMDMFGKGADVDASAIAVAVPIKVNARVLSILEDTIEKELDVAKKRTSKEDPVYVRMNLGAKEMRDQFPYYVDTDGNLVSGPDAPMRPPETPDEGLQGELVDTPRSPGPPPDDLAWYDPPTPREPRARGNLPRPKDELPPGDWGEPPEALGAGVPRRPLLPEGGPPTMRSREIPVEEATPLDLLAGNRLAQPRGGADEFDPLAGNKLRLELDEPFEDMRMNPRESEAAGGTTMQQAIDEAEAQIRKAEEKFGPLDPRDREQSMRNMVENKLGRPLASDQMLPPPSPELDYPIETRGAFEEAEAQVRKAEEKFGALSPEDRERSLIGMVSQKLGREVTREDLVELGLMGTGAGVALGTDEEELGAVTAAAGAGMGGGRRRRGSRRPPPSEAPDWPRPDAPPDTQPPPQLEATLDNGQKVRGFSALRRQQHLAQDEVETAKKRIGARQDETIHKRVVNWNQHKGLELEDQALLEEAQKVGKEKELRDVAGAAVYPSLKDRASLGGNGFFERIGNTLYLRADPILGALSQAEPNPFARAPGALGRIQQGFLENPAKRLFQFGGGAIGARYGNDVERIRDALFGGREEENAKAP